MLLVFAVIWGISAGIGAQAFYSVWTSELFATRYRATAQGVLFFAARVAVGALSYCFPTLLAEQGVPFVGTLMLGFLVIALVVGAVWAPTPRASPSPRSSASVTTRAASPTLSTRGRDCPQTSGEPSESGDPGSHVGLQAVQDGVQRRRAGVLRRDPRGLSATWSDHALMSGSEPNDPEFRMPRMFIVAQSVRVLPYDDGGQSRSSRRRRRGSPRRSPASAAPKHGNPARSAAG